MSSILHPAAALTRPLAPRLKLGLERPILAGQVNFPVCMAPMVGLSHVSFRLLVRSYLPCGARTLWPTEMLNSRRLPSENLQTTPETLRAEEETELSPQILANERDPIEKSIARLGEWGASAVDVNMGCPVKKALSHNYGVALMGDAKYAADVVRMAARASSLPISVKLRGSGVHGSGRDPSQNNMYLLDFVRGLEDAGASWITLHPRTAEQKRRGSADWEQIRSAREALSIPVIGNGDVQTAQDAIDLLSRVGCDMAMVGRALTARPWLLWQVGEKLGWPAPPGREGERAPQSGEEEGAEYGRALLRLSKFLRKHLASDLGLEQLSLRKFRFFVRTGGAWLAFGHELYSISTAAKTLDDLDERLAKFFSVPQSMSARTDLRQ